MYKMDLSIKLLEIRSLLVSIQSDLDEGNEELVKAWKLPSAIDRLDEILDFLEKGK